MSRYDKKEKRTLFFFITIFFLLAMGIAAGGMVSYRNFEQEFRRQAEHQISAIAELKVNELVAWRKERLGDARLLYHNPTFSALVERYFENPDDAEARAQLLTLLGNYQVYDQYDRVRLLDVTGVERISIPATPEAVDTHLVEAAASLRSGMLTFLDFHRDTNAGGRIHLALLVPIFSGQNNDHPLGVLVLRIDPNKYLYPYINQWPGDSASAETLLVRKDGEDVLFLNEIRFDPGAALNLRIPLTSTNTPAVKAVLGQTGVVEGIDYRDDQVLADLRAVPDSPWFLIAKMDTSEVYASLRTRSLQTFGLIVMAIFAAGAALLTVWRQQRILFYRAQVEAALALRESDERYRTVITNAPVVSFVTDEKGIFTLSEGKGLARLGVQPGQVVGLSVFDVYRDYPAILETMKNALAGQNQRTEVTVQDIVFDLFYSPVFDEHGKVIKVTGVANDITERKQAEDKVRHLNLELEQRVRERTAQLEAANKELEAFSYSVSHDLRAPLRGIDGWSQALLEDYQDKLDEQGRQYIDRVRSETQRMGRLIDDMLHLSRFTRAEMVKETVDLSALAQSVVQRLIQDEPQRNVDFNIQAGLKAQGDPHLLEAVLANLLGNALKFTGKRPHAQIEFGQAESDGQQVFFVHDNGAGFDMAYSKKLFGAFQRMHNNSEFPGTGIGLATVQRIIHRHGGHVWAEAQVEHGATFYFTLA